MKYFSNADEVYLSVYFYLIKIVNSICYMGKNSRFIFVHFRKALEETNIKVNLVTILNKLQQMNNPL